MVMRVGYRFQPTPEELVNYFLKEKRRDPDFTDPDIKEVNIYKHHPCELPGMYVNYFVSVNQLEFNLVKNLIQINGCFVFWV